MVWILRRSAILPWSSRPLPPLSVCEDRARNPFTEQIKAHLKHHPGLLVLDNFEHLQSAALELAELLYACPSLKVLVTSRQPLRLRWERRFAVPALALPDLRRPDPETIVKTASVALFIERAQAIQPDFLVDCRMARAIGELCWRLDGIPLAIEIATSRSNLLTPESMLSRLTPLCMLSFEDARDVPERHRMLRATIDWSHNLMSAHEQMAFRRLGILEGSFTIEEAATVGNGLVEEPREPLDTVLSLVDKSLLQIPDHPDGEPRLQMLGILRQYALEQLEAAGEVEEARRCHAGYFLSSAEQAASGLRGPDEEMWLDRVERDQDNLRAALSWLLRLRDAESALRALLPHSSVSSTPVGIQARDIAG
jgi:predicted ATPase